MTDVGLRDVAVLRVKPGEFLLIKLAHTSSHDTVEAFVDDLVAAGLDRKRFAVVNGGDMEFAVVEDAP